MSKIQVNDIVNHFDDGAPNFPKGIVVGSGATLGFNVGTGASIYSPSDNVLTLGTNNSERLRISSGGSVGIGTDNPSAKLHVSDGANGLEFNPNSNNAIVSYNRTTSAYAPNGLQGSTVQLRIGGVGTALHVHSDGKIGIGNDNPTYKVSVKDTKADGTGVQMHLWNNSVDNTAGNVWSGIRFTGSTGDYETAEIKGWRKHPGTDLNSISINTGGVERMVLSSSGVGIGTNSPQYPLVVGSGTDDALSVDTLSAGSGIVLRSFDDKKTDYEPFGIAAEYINFYTRTAVNSSSERMRINSGLPTLQVGKNGAANTSAINANTNLIADFGRSNTNGDIASISVGSGTYRVFSGKVPAIFNDPQTTLTATFQFASAYGVAVIEMDTVGGLAQVSVGRYLMIVDCDTSSGQTAQLTGGSSIQTILASGYGSPTFTASGASATPTFTVSWTRSGGVNSENWSNYWHFFARISNNSPSSPCVLTGLTMS